MVNCQGLSYVRKFQHNPFNFDKIVNNPKPTFLDILFDLFFLGVCLAMGAAYWYSGQYLNGLAFVIFGVLTIPSLVAGAHTSTVLKKFITHLSQRLARIFIGGIFLLYLTWEEILSKPFLGLAIIIIWLGISQHSFSRLEAVQAHERQVRNPVREKKSTTPGKEFTAADLTPGKKYCVIKEFTDNQGNIHPVGESWQYIEKNFLPHDDGLTLRAERDGQNIWVYLQWRKETQGEIIDNFHTYVQEG